MLALLIFMLFEILRSISSIFSFLSSLALILLFISVILFFIFELPLNSSNSLSFKFLSSFSKSLIFKFRFSFSFSNLITSSFKSFSSLFLSSNSLVISSFSFFISTIFLFKPNSSNLFFSKLLFKLFILSLNSSISLLAFVISSFLVKYSNFSSVVFCSNSSSLASIFFKASLLDDNSSLFKDNSFSLLLRSSLNTFKSSSTIFILLTINDTSFSFKSVDKSLNFNAFSLSTLKGSNLSS